MKRTEAIGFGYDSRIPRSGTYYTYGKVRYQSSESVRPVFEALCARDQKDRSRATEVLQRDLFR